MTDFRKYILLATILVLSTSMLAQFEDITESLNIEQTQVNNAFLGGGVAVVDVNNDGWEDLILTGGLEQDKLYLNMQGEVYVEQVNAFERFSDGDITSAVVAGDFNNDSCVDLLITNYTRVGYDLLYKNNCDGTFALVDTVSALSSLTNSIGATLFDFNNDGLLDIYIIGHVEENIFIRDDEGRVTGYDHVCGKNKLYINKGNFNFEDETDSYLGEGLGCSLAVTVIPRPDTIGYGILIANDFGPFLYPNEFLVMNEGMLKDEASRYNLDKAIYGMGIGIGDVDNDQDLDLYITNLGENILHINDGESYSDQQASWNVEDTNAPDGRLTTGWGTFFLDTDNDTDLDLYVANGTILSPEFIAGSFNDPNKLYINLLENETFIETEESYGIAISGANLNRGAAKGDIDNDGDEDIIVSYINFQATTEKDRIYKVFKNVTDNSDKHYLKVDLAPTRNAPGAYGATVKLYAAGEQYLNYKYSGGTHASQNTDLLHFGLDDITVVDSVEVLWRDQGISKFYNIKSDQVIRVSDESDQYQVLGCTDTESENYNNEADVSWGCKYPKSTNTYYTREVDGSMFVYPNPVGGSDVLDISVEYTNYQSTSIIELFDLLGHLVYSESVQVNGRDINRRISMKGLSDGMYLLQVSNEQGSISQKIIKN